MKVEAVMRQEVVCHWFDESQTRVGVDLCVSAGLPNVPVYECDVWWAYIVSALRELLVVLFARDVVLARTVVERWKVVEGEA